MKFKIEDGGPNAEVRYTVYVRERFLFFPVWSILGGSSIKEKAEDICQRYYDYKQVQSEPKQVREFEIL